MTPVVIQNLSKHFAKTVAVNDINLDIASGELFFLLGPSGCGKTTLLRMIAGFTEPTNGSIKFGEKNITSLRPEKRNTAMVFQGYALWPHMSVRANVAFGLDVRKVSRKEKHNKVTKALEMAHILELADRKPNQLSGGQQQRVALARALVIEPTVLLLDEPLSNLDAKLRIEMRSEIKRICNATGITAIYVTHDQKEALSMADKIAVMNSGKAVQVGKPQDLYQRPVNKFVAGFLGDSNFISAKLIQRFGEQVKLETDYGQLVSTQFPEDLPMSGDVTCSIRPEAIKLIPNSEDTPNGGAEINSKDNTNTNLNTFSAQVINTTFLGEIAEHVLSVNGAKELKAFELNPKFGSEKNLQISIDPKQVVVLGTG